MIGWFAPGAREPSLRRLISRQCECSRRSVHLLDEKYDFITDEEINVFLDSHRPSTSELYWTREINDCDDIARKFWCDSKLYFRQKGINAPIGFMTRTGTPLHKPHALNFYVRKHDKLVIFLDRYNRVPLLTRATLALM